MIALLADLAPALSVVIAVTLAAWRMGRHVGILAGEIHRLRDIVDVLGLSIARLDARLVEIERLTPQPPRRSYGPRSPSPRHPEAP